MLKKIIGMIMLSFLGLLGPTSGMATQHHSGHGGGSGGSGGGGKGCPKIGVTDIEPAPLSEIAPGTGFTVFVSGAKTAQDIQISVKKIPVLIDAVDKETFFDVTAKLPAELRGVPARVTVKVKSKIPGCDQESGWLYKITG